MALNLANFPDTVLELILSRNTLSAALISLWLCGNRILNYRLSTQIRTSFVVSVYEVRKWPRMLGELKRLKRLHLTAERMSEDLLVVQSQLFKLTPSLEELWIDYPGSFLLLVKALQPVSPWGYTIDMQVIKAGAHVLHPICEYFPSLRVLKSEATRGRPWIALRAVDFAHLPSTLVTLDLSCVQTIATDLSGLPRGLEELHMMVDNSASASLSTLPPNLTALYHLGVSSQEQIEALPPSVTVAPIYLWSWNVGIAQTLRPTTARLSLSYKISSHLDSFPNGWTSGLPRSLTHLTLHFPIGASDLALLPRTLEKLNIRGFKSGDQLSDMVERTQNASDCVSVWPPRLSVLSFGETFHEMLQSPMTAFPNTLTHLHGLPQVAHQAKTYCLHGLPTSLQVFSLPVYYPILDGPFPEGLTSLNLSAAFIQNLPSWPSGLLILKLAQVFAEGEVWRDRLATLPQTLEILELAAIDTLCAPIIPSSVKKLVIASNMVSKAIYALPKGPRVLVVKKVVGEVNSSLVPCGLKFYIASY